LTPDFFPNEIGERSQARALMTGNVEHDRNQIEMKEILLDKFDTFLLY